ncbi:MAG: hypothetical protein VB053_03465 [Oscillibacter ruminantium]|uniref:hypothetical protein n=1 Tax=Oscillibacter ruminantium TaxID=1263547 RepID=UPI002B1F1E60|nr:hypothetical protein [Oscillibacter ruminantium]MEA5041583.1 hypothetical protein [Oscillibacter ruminantium]
MEKVIVAVRYCGKDGEPSGRAFNYFTDIPLAVGDRVIADTYKGPGEAVVSEVNIPESKVDERYLSVLKTITRKVEVTE